MKWSEEGRHEFLGSIYSTSTMYNPTNFIYNKNGGLMNDLKFTRTHLVGCIHWMHLVGSFASSRLLQATPEMAPGVQLIEGKVRGNLRVVYFSFV